MSSDMGHCVVPISHSGYGSSSSAFFLQKSTYQAGLAAKMNSVDEKQAFSGK